MFSPREHYLILCFLVLFQLISYGGSSNSILDASNRFYTLIPHDFGMKKPPMLDNLELIQVIYLHIMSILPEPKQANKKTYFFQRTHVTCNNQ